MQQHVSVTAARALVFGAALAALFQISAAGAKECPTLVGGACHGHGPCSPPTGGVCTDTVTDCVCKAPKSKSGGLLGHLGITIGVGTMGHSNDRGHRHNDDNRHPADNHHPAGNPPANNDHPTNNDTGDH